MTLLVRYWSWFRDLTGVESETYTVPPASTLGALLVQVYARHPKLGEARRSTLVAVGLEYRPETHLLGPGDEVSLFPPVQGG